jgi:hypothetical protein
MVSNMQQQGKSTKEIDRMLQDKLNLTPAMGHVESSNEDDASIMSARDDVLFDIPYAYYDNYLRLLVIFCVTRTFQPFHRLVFILLHLTTNQMIEREGQAVWA